MIQPTVVARTFFNEQVAKFCEGDKTKAEKVPVSALVKAVLAVETREDAENFLAGHLHWLQGKYPRTIEAAMTAARANIGLAFDEGMKPERVLMWKSLWEEPVASSAKSPEEAFRTSQAVGEKIAAGKDPGRLAALAKKALQKRAAGR